MRNKCLFITAVVVMSFLQMPFVVLADEEKDHQAAITVGEIAERVSLSGLIEVEAGYESLGFLSGSDEKNSDVVLATAQLGINVEVSETFSGDLVFLYEEEPGSQVEVDEATVNFDNEQFFARVGRQYVPFGVFISHFISDPIVLDLGETQAGALLGGVRFGPAELALFAFNGDADKVSTSNDDTIDDFGASLAVSFGDHVEFGTSYLSDMADTGAELTLDVLTPGERTYVEKSAGWSAYALAAFDRFEFSVEALAAVDQLSDLGPDFDEPLAWNVELAAGISDAAEIALRFEGSDELAETPETQYGICYTRELNELLSLSLEYLHGEFDQAINVLDTRDIVTAKLALEF